MTLDLLAPFGRAPTRAGLFLDFDGVLADITPDPAAARVRPAVPDLLLALRQRLGRVAVISGRPVAYIADMIPEEIDVVGLYGLEWRSDGDYESLAEAERYRTEVGALIDDATATFGAEVVEPKGLSLTIHYRNDADLAEPMRDWAATRAERTGLEHRPAKQSFELHPPIERDKGTAVLELATGLDLVAFMGDDIGDLPAFDALDLLAERGVTTVRIVVDSEEAPPAMLERADLVIDGPAAAEDLLRRLLELTTPARH